jgi:hypothetical protein
MTLTGGPGDHDLVLAKTPLCPVELEPQPGSMASALASALALA